MKSNSFHIDIPLYRYKAILITGNTPKDCNEELARLWEENNPKDPYMSFYGKDNWLGRFTIPESDHPEAFTVPVLMLVTKPPKGQSPKEWRNELQITIAHESIHMAYDVLEYVGITVDSRNHEALTYLASHIHRTINSHIF